MTAATTRAATIALPDMNSNLAKLFARLEIGRTAILTDLESWQPEWLSRRPASNVWSALDVLEHIIKLEQAAVEAIPANLSSGHAIQFSERIKALAITTAMRLPARFKVLPGVAFTLPDGHSSLEQLTTDWQLARTRLSEFRQNRTKLGVFLHPLAGWMSMVSVFDLLDAHQQHHVYQLNRLRRTFGGPQ